MKLHTLLRSAPYVAYVLVIALFLRLCLYQCDPDTVGYLSVARYYAQGNWAAAVNGYWSPLVSWFMSLFFCWGKWSPEQQMLLFKGINFVAGIGVLYSYLRLLDGYVRTPQLRALSGISVGIWLAHFVLSYVTPDVLLLVPLLLLLGYSLQHQLLSHPYRSALLGAVLYFAKSYCFFVFLGYLSAYTLVQIGYARQHWRQILLSYSRIVGVFLALSGVWVYCLYQKYGTLMVSSAGTYAHAMMTDGTLVHYCMFDALLPLPHPQAHSYWEDISLSCNYCDWVPYDTPQHRHLQATIIKNSLSELKSSLFYVLPYTKLLLFILPFFLLKRQLRRAEPLFFYSILFIAIYLSGYLMLALQFRFLWMVMLLSILLCTHLLDRVLPLNGITIPQQIGIAIAFLYFNNAASYHSLVHQRRRMSEAQPIAQQLLQCAPLAGQHWLLYDNTDLVGVCIAFFSQSHYRGAITTHSRPPYLSAEQLSDTRIPYLLMPSDQSLPPEYHKCLSIRALCTTTPVDKYQYTLYKIDHILP